MSPPVTPGIDVRSFHALEELAAALAAFAADACDALDTADAGARRVLEQLEQRRRELESEIGRLESAQADRDGEREPNGDTALERRLDDARARLDEVADAVGDIADAYDAFRRDAWALRAVAADHLPAARGFVERKLEQLRAYTAVPIPIHSASGAALDQGNGMVRISVPATIPLPTGFRWVAIDQIEVTELAGGDFQKVTEAEMRRGFECLIAEVLPRMRSGRVDRETFRALDTSRGLSYSEGTERVFDAFFGGEPIRLDRRAGDPMFSITNGRHRIEVARHLGITHVPAQVEEVA